MTPLLKMLSNPERKPVLEILKGIHLPSKSKDTGSTTSNSMPDTPPNMPPLGPTRSARSVQSRNRGATKRRYSTNSLEGQRGMLRMSKNTLHGDLSLRDRIHHFTLAWYTCTMSTGGIAILLARTPHRFQGLTEIGDIFFLLSVILFVSFTATLTARFIIFPKALGKCITHPTESLFFPTFWISISNIISNIQEYGVPNCGEWLNVTLKVLFWTYAALTFLVAVGQYFFLFTGKPLTIQSMTPQWILPVFPIMLCGTLASLMGGSQPVESAYPILIAGLTFQGLGMLMATFMYGPYLRRLMTAGLPIPNTRPGMFIAVGPPSFTGLALLGMSEHLGRVFPAYTTISYISNPEAISDIFRVLSVATALFLWATAMWFFSIAVISVLHGAFISKEGMSFHLVWWAFVFPNVGFTICTIEIGEALMSEGILWVGSCMTVLLVVTWGVCAVCHVRAVWKKEILWPGKDEDHDQGGFIEEMEGRFNR